MKENQRKCVKCGASPCEKPDTILHRFPKPGLRNVNRCELWAKYCFPHGSWSSHEFQSQLHSEHRMLCTQHFNKTWFIDTAGKRLFKAAVPDAECDKVLKDPVLRTIEPEAGPSPTQPLRPHVYKMKYRKCEICGLKSERKDDRKRFFMARFPLDEDRCKKWVKMTGNEDLAYIPIEKLNQLKFVCGKHFDHKDFKIKKTQLKKTAIPSIRLTAKPLSDDKLKGFPCHLFREQRALNEDESDNSYAMKRKLELQDHTYGKHLHTDIGLAAIYREHNYCNPYTACQKENTARLPSGETQIDTECNPRGAEADEHIADTDSVPDAVTPVCQICLRTDFESTEMDHTLVDFYDELVYFDTSVAEPQFCPPCQHLLKKSYNFRQKCRRAHILLHKWLTSDAKDRTTLDSLHYDLPTSKLVATTAESNIKVYDYDSASQDETESVATLEKDHRESIDIGEEKTDAENTEDRKPDVRTYFKRFLDQDVNLTASQNENDDIIEEATPTKPTVEQQKLNYAQRKINKIKYDFKSIVISQMDKGELSDIEDYGTVLTKEVVLELVDKASINGMSNAIRNTERLRVVLQRILKRYNPVYESMFDREYLDTYAKAVLEFDKRKDSQLYLEAAYKCDLCYKVFESQAYLEFHKQWHNPEKQFVCDICPMRFDTEATRDSHKSKYHYVIYRCKLCHYYSHVHQVMERHYKEHTGVSIQRRGRNRSGILLGTKQVACDTCGKLYESEEELNKHQLAMHRERQFFCTLCGRDFASLNGLQNHIQLEHSDSSEELARTPTEQCTHCAAAFHRSEALDKHALTLHTWTETDSCKCTCGEVFANAEQLASHRILSKHKAKPQADLYRICVICDEILLSSQMYNHYRNTHPSESYIQLGTRILCELCGKGFKLQSQYQDHLNTHTGAKPYECSECAVRFALRSHAMKHLKRHSDPKYRCPYCDKMFHTNGARINHKKIHARERKHRCEICNEVFTSANTLKQHIDREHTNLKYKRKLRAPQQRVLQEKIANRFFKLQVVDEMVKGDAVEMMKGDADKMVTTDADEIENQAHSSDGNLKIHGDGDDETNQIYLGDESRDYHVVYEEIVQSDELHRTMSN